MNTALPKPRNRRMDILRAVAIVLVVLGHNFPIPAAHCFETYFPMAPYRMAIFLFASGYFFRDMTWKEYPSFLWKKTKGLAIPFLGWNVAYAGIISVLVWRNMVDYLPSIQDIWSFRNLLVEPFVTGHQYVLNLASWFVGMLYSALLLYGIFHILSHRYLSDHIMLVLYALVAVGSLAGQDMPSANHYWFAPLHIGYALFFIHFGKYYRQYIEPHIERVSSWIVIPVCLLFSFLTVRIGGEGFPYSLVWMQYGGRVVLPILMAVAGIVLWMRLSRIIEQYVAPNKLEKAISDSTWDIMTHHLTAKLIVGWLLIRCAVEPELTPAFRDSVWFMPATMDYWMIVGIQLVLPVLWHYAFGWLKTRLHITL